MSKNLADIQAILRQEKTFLSEHFRVKKLSIFGSYARGEERESSDLDLLIEYDHAPTLVMLIDLRNYLTNLVQIPVDLVTKPGLKQRIKERVLTEMIEI
jgi:uncharacterized protein